MFLVNTGESRELWSSSGADLRTCHSGRVPGFSDVRLRPLGADDKAYRRDGCISMGRVRPRSAPSGPGDIWELFSEVGLFGKIFQSDPLYTNPGIPSPMAATRRSETCQACCDDKRARNFKSSMIAPNKPRKIPKLPKCPPWDLWPHFLKNLYNISRGSASHIY